MDRGPGVRAVLGLGNPGADYRHSRHNLGFMVLDRVAERAGLRFRRTGDDLWACCWRPRRVRAEVVLAKPTTFMNESGRAAAQLRTGHGLDPAEILIVVDDIDLPFGRLRLRPFGGAGTHNGLRSVLQVLGPEPPRLRVGLGPREGQDSLADWVLDDFDADERARLPEVLDAAASCVEQAIRAGVGTAMNRFNPEPPER